MKQFIDIMISFIQILMSLFMKKQDKVEEKQVEVPKKEPELPKEPALKLVEESAPPPKPVEKPKAPPAPSGPPPLPKKPVAQLEASEKAYDIIKKWEGFRSAPYLCSAGVPTIGYGSTFYEDGERVTLEDPKISLTRAEKLLKKHTEDYEKFLKTSIVVELNQNQYDALVCFVYNIGPRAFKESTMLKRINKGDLYGASAQFARWNKVKGKPVEGLTKRRLDEQELFERKVL